MTLRGAFRRTAGAAILALAGLNAFNLYQRYQMRPKLDPALCVMNADQIKNPKTPDQQRLSRLFNMASDTATGKSVVDFALADGMKGCFNPALAETDACGFYTVGSYMDYYNLMQLNPSPKLADDDMARTIVHESRHKMQHEHELENVWGRNIPENERIAYIWFTEADARLTVIVHAYEQAQAGDRAALDKLRKDGGHLKMVQAFEKSLEQKPGDLKAAMRAGVLAFPEMAYVARNYANNTAALLSLPSLKFNPDRPVFSVLDDKSLMAFGAMGPHGNYMDAATAKGIRAFFTPEDYKELVEVRAKAGGTKGAACGEPAKTPAPAVPPSV